MSGRSSTQVCVLFKSRLFASVASASQNDGGQGRQDCSDRQSMPGPELSQGDAEGSVIHGRNTMAAAIFGL